MPRVVLRADHVETGMQHYLFYKDRLLLTPDNGIPQTSESAPVEFGFSSVGDESCFAAAVDSVPAGYKTVGLRDSYELLSQDDYLRAGKAAEILFWERTHQYCGQCGAKLARTSTTSKVCPKCHKEEWPMLSPAIIVLIHDGDRILLVRSKTFKGEYYGLVAGFVELGESLEDSVTREITEETQLEVENVRYFGSQPWPYPQGLMLGFIARYKGGELKLQASELVAGGWFGIRELPAIPKPLSMARQLIDHYISTCENQHT